MSAMNMKMLAQDSRTRQNYATQMHCARKKRKVQWPYSLVINVVIAILPQIVLTVGEATQLDHLIPVSRILCISLVCTRNY